MLFTLCVLLLFDVSHFSYRDLKNTIKTSRTLNVNHLEKKSRTYITRKMKIKTESDFDFFKILQHKKDILFLYEQSVLYINNQH